MHSTAIEAAVRSLLQKQYHIDPDQVAPDTLLFRPEGLGLSSAQALTLVLAVEEHFGMEFPESELGSQMYAHTLGSLSLTVQRCLAR